MNKTDYMNSLLALCTDRQKDIFNRMYPAGPSIKQINWAIKQLENTLSNLNSKEEEFKELQRVLTDHTTKSAEIIKELTSKLAISEHENKVYEKRIERLTSQINIDNANVQERLALLDALEAGGVDNWDGYDLAIDAI